MMSKFTLKRPSPLFISTSTPLVPLLHSPPPFVLLLLSLTFMLFCPVQSRLLCGPSVSQPPLNAIFIQATVGTFSLTDKNSFSPFHWLLIEFNWNILDYYLRNWMHPLSHCILSAIMCVRLFSTTFNCASSRWLGREKISLFNLHAMFPPSWFLSLSARSSRTVINQLVQATSLFSLIDSFMFSNSN